jgi:hypothetical protein
VPRALHRGGVDDDDGAGVVGLLQDALNAWHGFNIEYLRSDRNQGQVGQTRGFNAGLGGLAWGVDGNEGEPLLRHGGQYVLQSRRHTGQDLRVIGLAPVAPVRGRRLLVKVDDQRLVAALGGDDGQGKRQRGLAIATLLSDDSSFLIVNL